MEKHTTNESTAEVEKTRIDNFRLGIRAISQTAEQLLADLRRQDSNHPMLGRQLAALLKDLRQQRTYSMDLAMNRPANKQFDSYIRSLGGLRATVAQWLTIHAVNPRAIEMEATDFEMQCFSTLGSGVMWLESLARSGEFESSITDEQMLSLVFGSQKAQGEDITDQVQYDWSDDANRLEVSA
jgi:DNA-binding TFAR19-related protein (PDSD5 family)